MRQEIRASEESLRSGLKADINPESELPGCCHPPVHPMPTLAQTLMIVTALGVWSGVGVTVLIFLWNKLDKRFDDQSNEMNRRFDSQDKRFDSQDKRIDDLRDDVKELRTKVEDLPLKIMEMLSKAPR